VTLATLDLQDRLDLRVTLATLDQQDQQDQRAQMVQMVQMVQMAQTVQTVQGLWLAERQVNFLQKLTAPTTTLSGLTTTAQTQELL
jgi:phage FluMu protein gp41